MTKPVQVLDAMLEKRLSGAAADAWRGFRAESAKGASDERFCIMISTASRWARRSQALDPSAEETAAASAALAGWNPQRWSLLDALRVSIVWSRGDLASPTAVAALEEAFKYADEGELAALYRSLQALPDGARFAWRGGEGCRSNMRSVFEADVLDTAFPAAHFDDISWKQAVIKCLFVGAPLWRMYGLDRRLSADLARMALDLADERRSAHRPVPHELWLCLGAHGGERGLASLAREVESGPTLGRRGAAIGLARAGAADRVRALADDRDPAVAATARAAAADASQLAFRALSGE